MCTEYERENAFSFVPVLLFRPLWMESTVVDGAVRYGWHQLPME